MMFGVLARILGNMRLPSRSASRPGARYTASKLVIEQRLCRGKSRHSYSRNAVSIQTPTCRAFSFHTPAGTHHFRLRTQQLRNDSWLAMADAALVPAEGVLHVRAITRSAMQAPSHAAYPGNRAGFLHVCRISAVNRDCRPSVKLCVIDPIGCFTVSTRPGHRQGVDATARLKGVLRNLSLS